MVFGDTRFSCEAIKMRNRIRELRTTKGWSQQDLAEAYGTSQQHIQRMESGDQRLNTDHMTRLGEVFGIDPLEVLVDPTEQSIRAPVLDEIQAGAFVEAAADNRAIRSARHRTLDPCRLS